MNRGAWQATVHGITKSQTGLTTFTFTLKGKRRKYKNFFKKEKDDEEI